MKILQILRWLGVGLTVFGLYGCSTIKSWFPDKEKDYQFTSEIPELIVPEDLKNKGLSTIASPPSTSGESESIPETTANLESADQTVQTAQVVPEAEGAESQPEHNVAQTEVHSGTSASSLQIDQAQMPATRMVGRALSRKQMEIVERNIDKGYFYVKFDPNAIEAKDDTIWDEFVFLFGDDPSKEEEYRVTVHQVAAELSEVTIQDSSGKTLSDAVANALLKLITDGINEVVSQEDNTENSPVETKEQIAPEPAAGSN